MVACHTPNWKPGRQLRHVPRLGIGPFSCAQSTEPHQPGLLLLMMFLSQTLPPPFCNSWACRMLCALWLWELAGLLSLSWSSVTPVLMSSASSHLSSFSNCSLTKSLQHARHCANWWQCKGKWEKMVFISTWLVKTEQCRKSRKITTFFLFNNVLKMPFFLKASVFCSSFNVSVNTIPGPWRILQWPSFCSSEMFAAGVVVPGTLALRSQHGKGAPERWPIGSGHLQSGGVTWQPRSVGFVYHKPLSHWVPYQWVPGSC